MFQNVLVSFSETSLTDYYFGELPSVEEEENAIASWFGNRNDYFKLMNPTKLK